MNRLRSANLFAFLLIVGSTTAYGAEPDFPFVDVNHDGVFNAADGDIGKPTGVDIKGLILNDGYFDTSISEGSYVAPAAAASLVVPAPVRLTSSSLDTITISAEENLIFHGRARVSAEDSWIDLTAEMVLDLQRAHLTARSDITLISNDHDGKIVANHAEITAHDAYISINSEGDIELQNALVQAQTELELTTFEGSILGANARLLALGRYDGDEEGSIAIESEWGDHDHGAGAGGQAASEESEEPVVDFTDASLRTNGDLSIVTSGAKVIAPGARLNGGFDYYEIFIDSAGGRVNLNDAIVTQAGAVTLWTWAESESDPVARIDVENASIRTDTEYGDGTIELLAGGCGGPGDNTPQIFGEKVNIRAGSDVYIEAYSAKTAGFIDLSRSELTSKTHRGEVQYGDLNVVIDDDTGEVRQSTIDATNADVVDPVPPTFYAENVIQ